MNLTQEEMQALILILNDLTFPVKNAEIAMLAKGIVNKLQEALKTPPQPPNPKT